LTTLESGPASLAQLVTATGLARPTAHRIAVALERHRMVARDSQGRFVLGPRIAELATAAGEDRLLAIAQPILIQLRDLTGESAQLYRRQGSSRICVAAAERATGLRDTVPVGSVLPMSAGSAAQVLLAWEEPERVNQGLKGPGSRPPPWPRSGAAAGRPASPSVRPGWRRCPHRSAARAARSSPPSRSPGPLSA
jgi:DNA-binding IclR family transcriptional regulator